MTENTEGAPESGVEEDATVDAPTAAGQAVPEFATWFAGLRGAVGVTAAIAEDYLPMARAEAWAISCEGTAPTRAAVGVSTVPTADDGTGGAIALLPLQGMITPKGSAFARLFGMSSYGLAGFQAAFSAAVADPAIKAIVIDIDSPGGLVDLVPETAAMVRGARGSKPIVAVADTLAASAAYWIGAQADEFVVSPSGQVGSIGVFAVHEDISALAKQMGVKTTIVSAGKYKAEGSPFEPLSATAKQAMQGKIDARYATFVSDVAAGRQVSVAQVTNGYGEGRVLLADAALAAGMVDRIETLGDTLARYGVSVAPSEEDQDPDLDPSDGTDGDDPTATDTTEPARASTVEQTPEDRRRVADLLFSLPA